MKSSNAVTWIALPMMAAASGMALAAEMNNRQGADTHYIREPVATSLAERSGEAARWNSSLRYPDWWFDGPEGQPFAAYLAQGYRRYAKHEDHVSDFANAAKFGQRADAAERGSPGQPEELHKRTLPSYAVADLAAARTRLMFALGRGSGVVLPKLSASAQVMFDCWMEQQEENIQPHDVSACRNAYEDSMCRIEHAMRIPGICWVPAAPPQAAAAPPPAPAPAPLPACKTESFTVYFELDKDVLTPEARETIKHAAMAVAALPAGAAAVSAHTDRSASQAYNEGLSKRREYAVNRALIEAGLPRERLDSTHFGENRPRVMTPDGVRNQENRRVEIRIFCK